MFMGAEGREACHIVSDLRMCPRRIDFLDLSLPPFLFLSFPPVFSLLYFPSLLSFIPFTFQVVFVFILQSSLVSMFHSIPTSKHRLNYEFSHTYKGGMDESSLTALIEIIWSE